MKSPLSDKRKWRLNSVESYLHQSHAMHQSHAIVTTLKRCHGVSVPLRKMRGVPNVNSYNDSWLD